MEFINLSCFEEFDDNVAVRSIPDPVLIEDGRVLKNLLRLETVYTVQDYFKFQDNPITPDMRSACVHWMIDVCREELCEPPVLLSAINFMDRYLTFKRCQASHFQLLGCACLLLASKLRQFNPLSVQKLLEYTMNSYSALELLHFELVILNILKWDTLSVIPTDFMDILLSKITFPSVNSELIVRKYAIVFVEVCMTIPDFIRWRPSMLALGCLGASLKGIKTAENRLFKQTEDIAEIFKNFININKRVISYAITRVEVVISTQIAEVMHISRKNNPFLPVKAAAKVPQCPADSQDRAPNPGPSGSQDGENDEMS